MDVRELGRLMKQLSDKMEATANANLRTLDLTIAQSRVLLYLGDQPDQTATQRELEAHLRVSHATVHGLLSRMEAKGLVRVRPSAADRRMRIVRLNTGDDTLKKIRAQQKEHMSRVTRDVDVEQLSRMLQIMLENQEKYLTDGEMG